MANFAVILPAAGQSSRFKDKNYKKPFAPLESRAVWLHSAEKFLNRKDVKQLIIVISEADREFFTGKFGANIAIMGIDAVVGGSTRAESVRNAVEKLNDDIALAGAQCAADSDFPGPFTNRRQHNVHDSDAAYQQ